MGGSVGGDGGFEADFAAAKLQLKVARKETAFSILGREAWANRLWAEGTTFQWQTAASSTFTVLQLHHHVLRFGGKSAYYHLELDGTLGYTRTICNSLGLVEHTVTRPVGADCLLAEIWPMVYAIRAYSTLDFDSLQ